VNPSAIYFTGELVSCKTVVLKMGGIAPAGAILMSKGAIAGRNNTEGKMVNY